MQKFNRSTIQEIVNFQNQTVSQAEGSVLLGIYQPKGCNWSYEVRILPRTGQVYVTQFGHIVENSARI